MTGILVSGQFIPDGDFQIASSDDLRNDSQADGKTVSATFNVFKTQIAGLTGDVARLDESVVTVNGKISTLDGQVAGLTSDVATISGQVTALKGSLIANDSNVPNSSTVTDALNALLVMIQALQPPVIPEEPVAPEEPQ